MAFGIHRLFYSGVWQRSAGSLERVTRTSRTGSFGHQEYLALLLAGSLFQVAFILVGVTIGAAHGHVVIVTLMEKDREQQC